MSGVLNRFRSVLLTFVCYEKLLEDFKRCCSCSGNFWCVVIVLVNVVDYLLADAM